MTLYTNRATAYIKVEEWKKACDDCERVIHYYDVFEEEVHKNLDIYIKALTRKAYALEKEKNYKEALECIDKAKEFTESEEIVAWEHQIKQSEIIHNESLKTWNISDDSNLTTITIFIDLLRKSIKDTSDIKLLKSIATSFDEIIKLIKTTTDNLKNKEKDDNKYILYWNISNGISLLFTFLNCLSLIKNTNDNKDVVTPLVTKTLNWICVIHNLKKYMNLINNVKGYNNLIVFLFTTESNSHKISITLQQATLIMSLLEEATLNDNCRKTILDIGQLDSMSEIVLRKYDLSKIHDIQTAMWLSKVYTFICNICYSSDETRAKVSLKVSSVIYTQLNQFISSYKCEIEHHRDWLSSIISFIMNLSCDWTFRKNLAKEKKFLKFLSENLLIEWVNNELFMKKNQNEVDEIYEKTAALFYNLSFLPGEETEIIKFYYDIHIEAFIIYYMNHKVHLSVKASKMSLWRSWNLLSRMIKINSPTWFALNTPTDKADINSKDADIKDQQLQLSKKEKTQMISNLLKYIEWSNIINGNNDIVESTVRIFAYWFKGINTETNDINAYLNKEFVTKLIRSVNIILLKDCAEDASKIGDSNYERVANVLSWFISIMDKYRENAVDMKEIVLLIINICKEKTDLIRKNAAYLLARIARASTEMEDYVRSLHGMDVLVNVSKFLNIHK